MRTSAPVAFDIGAQPLASALDVYSAATGLQVVYDATLASGRRSRAVAGSMPPDMALRILLDGSGLTAVYAATNAFTVVPAVAERRMSAASLDSFRPYLAAVQTSIAKAFCRSSLTTPGTYRVEFRFWIGPVGEVLQPELLTSTHDEIRDQAIAGLLRALTIGRPPPRDMPQPVAMAVSPRPPAQTGDCGAAGADLASPVAR
ncbi:STN domain-containing protein [Bradyrhizobium sp. 2TAF24]|uniref:STN domain-containing protein n=1 Tax=Bradyrhizobium sp. 2TAF24 TaxID=3233011 RepID=UPI003F929752